MGSRALDKFVLDIILEAGVESVSLIGPNERTWLVKQLEGVGIEVDIIDSRSKSTR